MRPKSYAEKFTIATDRVNEYLLSRDSERCISIRDVRRYLHGSSAEALLAPVLIALEKAGVIECVPPVGAKESLLYFTEAWYFWKKEVIAKDGNEIDGLQSTSDRTPPNDAVEAEASGEGRGDDVE